METFWQDVKFGLRMLVKNPGFTVVAVLTLALGIGLNTAAFSLVNAVLFRPLPVTAPGELVYVYTQLPKQPIILTHQPNAYPDYLDFRDQTRSFQSLAGYAMTQVALDQGDETSMVFGEMVSGNYFATLGLQPAVGRLLAEEDDRQRGANPVMVISHAAWQRRFGGDPSVMGRTVRLNGTPMTVIGVAPPGFYGMLRGIGSELWLPITMSSALRASPNVNLSEPGQGDRLDNRGRRWVWMIGRLRPGVTPQQADAEVRTIGEQLRAAYPESNEPRAYATLPAAKVSLLPGLDTYLSGTSAVLMGVVGLLLLIACANVASMLLARAAARRREIAMRLTLGASRPRLIRQLLVESLLLALLGGLPAIALAYASNAGLVRFASILPLPFQVALELALDTRVLLFTLAAAALTAVVFGLAPALAATRADLVTALKEEAGASIGGGSRARLRSALVVAQVALSLVLLVIAGLSLRSLQNAHRIDPGFDPNGVVVASVAPSTQGYSREQADAFFKSFTDRLRAVPGVEQVTTATNLPLTFDINSDGAAIPGHIPAHREEWAEVDTSSIGPGYFATMGIPLVRGREFTERDRTGEPRVAVVNEAFAGHFWPGQDPMGRTFQILDQEEPFQVVGVARDGKYRTLGEDPRMFFYQSLGQNPAGQRIVVARTRGSVAPSLVAMRQVGRELDAKVPVTDIETLDVATSGTLLVPRMGAVLFGMFGVLGMVLAAVGLYGVIAYAVSQRTREIGIRVALGAQRGDILRLVVRQGLLLTAAGIALGVAAALAVTQVLTAFLYGINARDPLTFGGVALLLGTVALLACFIPARRAARVEPMVALRYE